MKNKLTSKERALIALQQTLDMALEVLENKSISLLETFTLNDGTKIWVSTTGKTEFGEIGVRLDNEEYRLTPVFITQAGEEWFYKNAKEITQIILQEIYNVYA